MPRIETLHYTHVRKYIYITFNYEWATHNSKKQTNQDIGTDALPSARIGIDK